MKFFFLLTFATANIYAGVLSINPGRTVTPLVDIYNSSNKKIDETKMEVRVSSYNKAGDISKGSEKREMSVLAYQSALKQANAVFRMIPNQASLPADGTTYQGTAFHIGNNLILTNGHVLSPDHTNTTECGGFELHDGRGDRTFACKKVHYCNTEHDVCLIEMAPLKKCLNLLCSKKTFIDLSSVSEALKLKAKPEMNYETIDTAVMTAVGNTMGLGIHFSQGRGYRITNDSRIYFYAPLRAGNSGGPLIGEDGLVWGLVKQESAEKVGAESYNVAATMEKVISLMNEQVADQEILKKFNSSVSK